MIISIDCETAGLDATKFLMGCIAFEHKQPEYFKSKDKLWQRVLQIGRAEAKRKKVLTVYSHNAQYDTACYINLEDKNLKFYSNSPFIWAYEENGKEIIKFLDTYSIFRMPLKQVGEIINYKKLEMPREYYNENTTMTKELFEQTKPYILRDCEICLKAIKYIKDKLKEDNVKPKRIITINQIAISYIIKKLQEEKNEQIFENRKMGIVYETHYPQQIHSAYRGGRVEAFKTGEYDGVTAIDCNSLYPYALTKIKFPDLRTESFWNNPDNSIIMRIGISQAMIKNKTNELGILPIRINKETHYLQKGQIAIGTWTNMEIKEAIINGHEIIKISWGITWKETKNPFETIMEQMYKKRLNTKDKFNKYFYKMMMNCALGKMAQHRINQEILIDNVEKAEEYLRNNYEIIKGINYNYMYKGQPKNAKKKPYYMPIIPCLVNAYARIYMNKEMRKLKKENLLYTDTDSIISINGNLKNHEINNTLGSFKIEEINTKALIYGKKAYSIGNKIKLSGISKRLLNKKIFEKGEITSEKMITIKTAQKLSEVGTFIQRKRSLKDLTEKATETKEMLSQQVLLIDSDIKDITEFKEAVNNIFI